MFLSHPLKSLISSSLVGGLGSPGSPDREEAEFWIGPPGGLFKSPGANRANAAPPTRAEISCSVDLPTSNGGGFTPSSLNSLLGGPDGQDIIFLSCSGDCCFIAHITIASLKHAGLSKDQQYLVVALSGLF